MNINMDTLRTILETMSPITLSEWIADLENDPEGNRKLIVHATTMLENIVGIDEATMMLEQTYRGH